MKKFTISVAVLFITICFDASAQLVAGKWTGVLNVQGSNIQLYFTVTTDSLKYTATLDIPAQRAKKIPVTVETNGNAIAFLVQGFGISYDGKVLNDSTIEGTFKQSGLSIPLNLSRSDIHNIKRRSQDPAEPFPYISEEINIVSRHSAIISGTLTRPKTDETRVLIVLISGSGPQDRDSKLFGHRPFLVLSDYLTRNGYCVYRYDDRGTGKSTGATHGATTANFAEDVVEITKFFRSKKQFARKKIVLIGHSEGGLIAPLAAQELKELSAIVLMAAPGVPCRELLLRQQYEIGKLNGMSDLQLERAKLINSNLYDLIVNTDSSKLEPVAREYLRTVLTKDNSSLSEKEINTFVDNQIRQVTSPWLRFFVSYNPATALRKLKCPVLAINGDRDIQVSADENLTAIEQALQQSKSRNYITRNLKGLNHLFQECNRCTVDEYSQIDQTISPAALSTILDWFKRIGL